MTFGHKFSQKLKPKTTNIFGYKKYVKVIFVYYFCYVHYKIILN